MSHTPIDKAELDRLSDLVAQWDRANNLTGETQAAVRFEVGNFLRNEVNAIVRAGRLALVPDGYVVVPREPTFEMKMAGANAITADHMKAMANYDAACDCWPAMIEAGGQHDD